MNRFGLANIFVFPFRKKKTVLENTDISPISAVQQDVLRNKKICVAAVYNARCRRIGRCSRSNSLIEAKPSPSCRLASYDLKDFPISTCTSLSHLSFTQDYIGVISKDNPIVSLYVFISPCVDRR
jgi:hypothetical protein